MMIFVSFNVSVLETYCTPSDLIGLVGIYISTCMYMMWCNVKCLCYWGNLMLGVYFSKYILLYYILEMKKNLVKFFLGYSEKIQIIQRKFCKLQIKYKTQITTTL